MAAITAKTPLNDHPSRGMTGFATGFAPAPGRHSARKPLILRGPASPPTGRGSGGRRAPFTRPLPHDQQ
jgi:hypothetical protein